MKISVYSIEKSKNTHIGELIKEYQKMIGRFAKIDDIIIFNKIVANAQAKGESETKASYSRVYEPFLKGYTVALDVKGEEIDSYEFGKIFQDKMEVNFFIGGAFGFEKSFLDKTKKVISLSRLTYAHKIAKAVLFEQIYRGLCINANHPYHK